MKRVLSWGVLTLSCIAAMFLFTCLTVFAAGLFAFIRYKSETLFWVLVVLEGLTFLGIVLAGIVLGGHLVVRLSQMVWKSRAGVRYVVVGGLTSLVYGIYWLLMFLDIAYVEQPYLYGVIYIIYIIFGVSIVVNGKSAVKNDGLPPSKREVLEEKLAKIVAKEKASKCRDSAKALAEQLAKMEATNIENKVFLKNAYSDITLNELVASRQFTREQADEYAKRREAVRHSIHVFPDVRDTIEKRIESLERGEE